MQMLDSIQNLGEVIQAKLSHAEYWEIISAEMNFLYLLSFLLTANKEIAEQCLEHALNDFAEGTEDFVGWASARGRDAVLKHAIRIMKPDPEATRDEMDFHDGLGYSAGDRIFGSLAGLPVFERFVFVMTRIHGHSDADCANLLATTRWEVAIARELTELVLATNKGGGPGQCPKPAARFEGGFLFKTRCASC